MNTLTTSMTFAVIVVNMLTLTYVGLRLHLPRRRLLWLGAVAILATLTPALYLLAEAQEIAGVQRGVFLIVTSILLIAVHSALVITDISPPSKRTRRVQIWAILSAIWLVALIVASFIGESAIAGSPEWMIRAFTNFDASALVTVIGFFALTISVQTYAFWYFFRTAVPELANRALFWASSLFVFDFALFVIGSGTQEVAILTMPLLSLTVIGTAYALSHHHIFDVRSIILSTVRVILHVIVGSIISATALIIALDAQPETDARRFVTVILLAIGVALVMVPVRLLIDLLLKRFIRQEVNAATITREYSQLIAEVIELDTLVPSATETLNRLLKIETSAIILLSHTSDDVVSVVVMHPNRPNDHLAGQLSVSGAIYRTLAKERKTISQFDLEFAPEYKNILGTERSFFRSLGLSAYAPITLDYTMIGVLAVGRKLNDTAYYSRDFDLIATLAQQTGIALRNARLVEDLQHLNKSMQNLNLKLKSSNEQLSRMDSVKSDFVTIASHELRTPLAQIRGYTDIMDALNESGMLDQDQTTTLISNLRKATERMEELISAMLDVSQLDIEAMDLRFAQTSIESLVKMAIEPLTDAIRQRKLTLSARGLRGLPAVQADLQRLVQAFRNVIVNAIKFTPDGGKIDIVASLQEAKNEDDVDHILIQIKDTGVGIDKGNLEMIFKKFFRAYDPSLHSTGTYKFLGAGPGLGLTITRGVIEGHGGRIWAESPGHDMEAFPGATFNIVLPVSTPDNARRVLSFEATAANDAIGRTSDMQQRTSMRRPDHEKEKAASQEESA